MKKGNRRKSRWLFLLFLATGYWLLATDVHAGQATAHNYFYKLALGDKGQPQVDLVNAALDRADAELAILAAGGSLSATAPLTYNSSTGVIALPQAGASASGYLASADWSAFNAKQAALPSGTSSQYLRGDLTMQTLNQAAVAGLTTASSPSFAALTAGSLGAAEGTPALTLQAATSQGYGDPVLNILNKAGSSVAFIDELGFYWGGAALWGLYGTIAGPTQARTYTFPDSAATMLYSGGALGTPASGNLSSCTFPTLNQSTTGTAANLSGTPTLPSGTTLVAPVLGTPASGVMTHLTGLPVSQNGFGTEPTALTPGSSVAITASAARTFTLTPAQTESITVSGGTAGQDLYLLILTSGSSSFTLTFSTGFHSAGTLATGTSSNKYFLLHFVNVGGTYFEVSRTAAM